MLVASNVYRRHCGPGMAPVPARAARLIATVVLPLTLIAWLGDRMAPESAPVARGAAYAEVRGCIDCHGDAGDPLAAADDDVCSTTSRAESHPDYDVACADALAYFATVRLRKTFADRANANPNNPLIAGERLARQYHCFQCHGKLGQGGFKNTKSLKGYVPGYFGADFKRLTNNADPDSVRAWIVHGVDAALLDAPVSGPIAAYFLKRQAVSMPSYKSLQPDEIETLVQYVIALHRIGPMTAQTAHAYEERTIRGQ